jgi:hypothetical protein
VNLRTTAIESSFNRAEFRWKWLRFLRRTMVIGMAACVFAILFGFALRLDWIPTEGIAITCVVLLCTLTIFSWGIMALAVFARVPDRHRLAMVLDKAQPRLLDRLTTLEFLEGNPRRQQRGPVPQTPHAASFAPRIAGQAQEILESELPRPSFPALSPVPHLLVFALALGATIAFYRLYTPWQHIGSGRNAKPLALASSQKPLELPVPTTNNLEESLTWGEVRITDPATDLRVTKVDVVPLQIEAAANQPLESVRWFSTINGAAETPHALPPPSEPRFAVYQPSLYLDEFKLSDWDVMTYYAKAKTQPQNSYASDIYFLEVRPFREDMLKLPGGEGGKAYQCLSEISGLIARQQQVIRQTHQHLQAPPPQPNLRAQDRKKLSEAESDLGDSARHLYAKMASEMENAPIGEALDHLSQAGGSLDRSSSLLESDVMDEAQNQERSAMSDLVAARKMFQKALSDNPGAFGDKSGEDAEPVADSSKKLRDIAEFRNTAKATQDFLEKTLEKQRALEQRARTAPRSEFSDLADKEQQLAQSLSEFRSKYPQMFRGVEDQTQQTQQAMNAAADALQKRAGARNATQEATRKLESLNDSMQNQSAQMQLANAYRLKQMLDDQVQALDQSAQPGSSPSTPNVQKTATQARETVSQLKKAVEQEPTRDAFGQPLRDALSGQKKVDLDAALTRLQQAEDASSRQQRAREARDRLAAVSRAFAASEPSSFQFAQQSDALKQGGQDSFATGMAELESLLKELENQRPISPQDQASQGRQALFNLQTGARSRFGNDDHANQILVQLQKMLKSQTPLDVGNLKKLAEDLQHFSVETADHQARTNTDVANIDPARLPPAYRGRIQKYFQKLSEK